MYANNLRLFARGDVVDAHQAELAGPGTPIRVWNERETAGSAFIPTHRSEAPA